jgi:hypothetical protein
VEQVEREVEELIVKNSRNLMRMRISRKRQEFGYENFSLIDREGGEGNAHDIKPIKSQ